MKVLILLLCAAVWITRGEFARDINDVEDETLLENGAFG